MKITKKQARQIILNHIIMTERLPIYDEVLYNITSKNIIQDYTFRGLLKYIYDLK